MIRRAILDLTSLGSYSLFLLTSFINVSLSLLLQTLTLPFDKHRKVSLAVNRWIWGHLLFFIEPSIPISRKGNKNIGKGPYIVVCNHGSVLDIPACMGLSIPIRVVARSGIFKVPLLGAYMRFSKQIMLDSSTPEGVEAFLQSCKESLENGVSVLLFPEGTRSVDGKMGKFNRGAFRLSKDTGIPILPVIVEGTRQVLGKGSLRINSFYSPITMSVLDPVMPGEGTAKVLSNKVHYKMVCELKKVQGDRQTNTKLLTAEQ